MATPQRAPRTHIIGDEFGKNISSTGEYVGVFTRADALVAKTGAEGISFSFKSADGSFAKYIDLYTHNKEGNPTYGGNLLSAIMVCLKSDGAAPQLETHRRWDEDLRKFTLQEIYVYPSLINTEIGILLRREEYMKSDGTAGVGLGIVASFDAQTRRSASELVNDLPAKEIDSIRADLGDRLLDQSNTTAARIGITDNTSKAPAANSEDFDDDIPF